MLVVVVVDVLRCAHALSYGGCSQVVTALACGANMRGFDSHHSPSDGACEYDGLCFPVDSRGGKMNVRG